MTQPRALDAELPVLAHPLAVDFANSTGPPARIAADVVDGDLLRDAAGLRRWLATEAHAVSDIELPAIDDVGDLERLRAFRTAITQLLRERARGQAPPTSAIAAVNAASAAAPIHPELVIGATGARLASHAHDWASELRGRIARSATSSSRVPTTSAWASAEHLPAACSSWLPGEASVGAPTPAATAPGWPATITAPCASMAPNASRWPDRLPSLPRV